MNKYAWLLLLFWLLALPFVSFTTWAWHSVYCYVRMCHNFKSWSLTQYWVNIDGHLLVTLSTLCHVDLFTEHGYPCKCQLGYFCWFVYNLLKCLHQTWLLITSLLCVQMGVIMVLNFFYWFWTEMSRGISCLFISFVCNPFYCFALNTCVKLKP